MRFVDSLRERPTRAPVSQRTENPVSCPGCQSASIVTTAKDPDESSYWRCKACGEVWNASRHRRASGIADGWRR